MSNLLLWVLTLYQAMGTLWYVKHVNKASTSTMYDTAVSKVLTATMQPATNNPTDKPPTQIYAVVLCTRFHCYTSLGKVRQVWKIPTASCKCLEPARGTSAGILWAGQERGDPWSGKWFHKQASSDGAKEKGDYQWDCHATDQREGKQRPDDNTWYSTTSTTFTAPKRYLCNAYNERQKWGLEQPLLRTPMLP